MSSSSTSSSVSGDGPDLLLLQKEASVAKMMISALVAILPSVAAGTSMAFSSTAASQYRTENATSLFEPLNDEESSWFVSIMSIALMIGILSSGAISDRFGFKFCLIFGCAVQALSWVMLYWAPNFMVLISGRVISGLGSGICTPASYVFVSEIALIRYRGMLSTLNTLVINCAFLYSFIMGATIPFNFMIPLSAFPLIVFFALSWKWLYNSPSWYVKRNRTHDAIKVLVEIRGPRYRVDAEIDELESIVSQQENKLTIKQKFSYLISRAVLMPLSITLVLFAFQATSGADTVTYYSLDIFAASRVEMSPYILAILVQGSFTIGYALSTPLLNKMKRKSQFIMSGAIMVASYTVLGFCLYLKDDVIPDSMLASVFGFVAPACVILSALGYGLGFGPIVYSLTGDILPPRVRGMCCSLVLACRFVFVFSLLKVFPSMVNSFGLPVVFWLHSFICLAGTIFAFIFLPETQGKTLAELSNLFVKKSEKKFFAPNLTLTKEQEAAGFA